MNIACVIILYHPDESILLNIQSYISYFEKVFVIDNTEGQETLAAKEIGNLPKINYLHDGQNKGISSRLNEACNYALLESFEWILTMDQDSSFETDAVAKYINCINTFSGKNNVAMFGTNYENKSAALWDCRQEEVSTLITSGAVVNLNLFKMVGEFDENLFIDYVDVDYCLKAQTLGYKIILFKNINLKHRIGNISVHRSLKSFKKTERSLHSPTRFYYMTRNFFYVSKKYDSNFPAVIKTNRKNLMNRIKNNFLYSENRIAVFRYIIKGFFAYRKKQMGKLSN